MLLLIPQAQTSRIKLWAPAVRRLCPHTQTHHPRKKYPGDGVVTRVEFARCHAQGLNRQIYAALGAANGIATEALGNIRTIKAMSTEEMEAMSYHEATGIALKTGVKDAWGTAGMTTINSYMDLAANVLVLWYGGWLAIEQDGRMTAGKLITYQVACPPAGRLRTVNRANMIANRHPHQSKSGASTQSIREWSKYAR